MEVAEVVYIAVHHTAVKSRYHLYTNTNLHPHTLSHLPHIHVELEVVEVVEVLEVLVPVVQELCKTPKNLFPILHSRYP